MKNPVRPSTGNLAVDPSGISPGFPMESLPGVLMETQKFLWEFLQEIQSYRSFLEFIQPVLTRVLPEVFLGASSDVKIEIHPKVPIVIPSGAPWKISSDVNTVV